MKDMRTNDDMKQWAITQVVAKGLASASVAQAIADHMTATVTYPSLVEAIREGEEEYAKESGK
jgi:hypothetical protein